MIRQFAKHHNKIQFFGYEVANVVLVVQQALQRGTTGYGLNYETFSALSLLAGSAFIWRFDPERRPHLLLYGGIALTIGGLFLMAAGYIMTGLAVAVASLETARGGLLALQDYIDERSKKGASVESFLDHTLQIARLALGWYLMPIDYLTSKFQHFGRFINDRPFITGTLIKAPMRLEFIVKKMLIGDWIGAAVGISWMTLGDVALAFNDAKLQAFVEQRDAAPSYILIGANQTGKTSLLRSAAASVAPTIQPISDASDPTRDCDWWMFPTATILDTTGRYAFPVQGQDDGEPWQRLLARLRRWRNRRPIQGLLVAVAADTLASQEPDALRHDAMELRQRIHEAKQALKVDLPVYLILTRCDVIEGFTEFFEAMPKPSLQQAFGATQAVQQGDHNSSIVEPSVTAVLDPLVDRLRKLRLHLLTTGKASSAALRRAIFCFPEEFRALQPSIRLFVETLFTPSPHLSALSFRGLFLSSACQQGTPVSLLRYRFRTSLPSQRATEDRQPYFLHDLFTTILPRDQANASDTRRPSILRTRAVLAPVAGLAIGWLLFKYSINENPFILIAIFLAGLVSGFLGAIAGSGGLVAVPALMALGLPAQVAIATNRLGALGQWLGAIGKFHTEQKIVWSHAIKLCAVAMLGGFIGARLLIEIDESLLRRVVGVVLLAILPLVYFSDKIGQQSVSVSNLRLVVGYALSFLVTIFAGLVSAGDGTLMLYVMMSCFGLTITEANATRAIPWLLLGIVAVVTFIFDGIVNYAYGVMLFLGMVGGGYIGARTAIRKGDVWVKRVFASLVVALSLKLLLSKPFLIAIYLSASAFVTSIVAGLVGIDGGVDLVNAEVLLFGVYFIGGFLSTCLGTSGGITFASTAAFLPATAVIPIHGSVESLASLFRWRVLRDVVDHPFLKAFGMSSIVGFFMAWPLIGHLSEPTLRLILAITILIVAWVPFKNLSWDSPWLPYIGGCVTSFLTILVGATGPFVAALLMKRYKDQATIVATHTACMTLQHGGKILIFGLYGFPFMQSWMLILSLILATVLGTLLGKRALFEGPKHVFTLVLKLIVTGLAIKILLTALS